MKNIIRKILPANLRQQIVRRLPRRIDRLMCKSLLWATRHDAKVLGMPENAKNWGDYWVSKHLERLSLYDKILVDISTKPSTGSSLKFYRPKIRHAYQIDFLNKAVPIEDEKRLTLLQTDPKNPLPLPDASVDIIIGTRAFASLSPTYRLLQVEEIERILRPGGNIFITMLYYFGLSSSLAGHSDESDEIAYRNHLEMQLNIASILEKLDFFDFDAGCDLSQFPGFEGFSEKHVLKLPDLITFSPNEFEDTNFGAVVDAANVRCAEIGIIFEKPRLGQIAKRFAPRESEEKSNYGKPKKAGADDMLDARLACLLSVFQSIAGIRILNLYDDGSEFSEALETAGATVHSCVLDSNAYKILKQRYPDRHCWIYDLERPWSLKLSERYDAVLAFGVLDQLSDPRPFLKHVTQLAPAMLIDMPYQLDQSKFKKMIDPLFLKDQMQQFDVEAHEFAEALSYSRSITAVDEKAVIGHSIADKKMAARRVFLCRRQRDHLEPLLVHVHIPKAAGQAFEDFLSRNFPGRVRLFYPEKPAAAQWDLFKKEIQDDSSPLVFSSQSMNMYFPPLLGNRIPLYVSFFRHPFSMIFSYVKYIKKNFNKLSPAHRAILPDNLRSMSIEESVKWHIRNGGFFPLPVLELTKGLDVARTKDIVDRFFFTGIVEEMDRSIRLLSLKLEPYGLHFENMNMPRKNTTQDVDLEGYDFHSDKEFQEFARKELYQEVEFYEWVRERFEKEANYYGI
jgi:SAM-dependent methyltransferase